MRLVNIVIAASILFSILGIANLLLLRVLHSSWWKLKAVRIPAMLLPVAAIASAALWAVAYVRGWPGVIGGASVLTPGLFIVELALLVSLPISGIMHFAAGLVGYVRRRRNPSFSGNRRQLIKKAAAVFPAIAVPSALAGVADSFDPIKIPVRNIPVADLPPVLLGLKIAHLSDLHLGYYVHLDHLEDAIDKIIPHNPDLVVVTGDISDDLDLLPKAIEIVNRLSPRFGIYAGVGNHEYYRGIKEVLRIFSKAPFPMIINRYINISAGTTRIVLGGADDPRTLRRDYSGFLQNTIESTMRGVPSSAFRILMCHRPEGFNYSALKGIDLVLSGHTHGGQIGLGGRSLFEPIFPERYLWGIYRRGKTTLHTSGGMGHWLPFRLGVPAEAPILVLEKGRGN
jgi:predicted MPP superfamily phosphohydrolase